MQLKMKMENRMKALNDVVKKFYRETVEKGDVIEFRGSEEDFKEIIAKARKPIIFHIYDETEANDELSAFTIELAHRNPGLSLIVRTSLSHFQKKFPDYDFNNSAYMVLQPGPARELFQVGHTDENTEYLLA